MERWKCFYELIESRRSIREFTDQPVEEDKITNIIQALRLAPSSSNSQPWHVVVVRDREVIEKLSRAAPLGSRGIISWLETAPVVLVLTVRKKLTHQVAGAFGHGNVWLDAGIGGQHMVLAAHALGLGACWIGWFSEKKVSQLVQLPKSHMVAALIPCGYPAQEPAPRPRKDADQLYSMGKFGNQG